MDAYELIENTKTRIYKVLQDSGLHIAVLGLILENISNDVYKQAKSVYEIGKNSTNEIKSEEVTENSEE